MYPAVVKVTPGDNYILSVVFDNGESGYLDMKPLLDFGVFNKLKDNEVFRTARVVFDAVGWECGVDLDPEYIYAHVVKSGP